MTTAFLRSDFQGLVRQKLSADIKLTSVPILRIGVKGTAYECVKTELKDVETFRQEADRTC